MQGVYVLKTTLLYTVFSAASVYNLYMIMIAIVYHTSSQYSANTFNFMHAAYCVPYILVVSEYA
jgi:hypothetical protein